MAKTFGLNLGTNSIGWAILDDNSSPNKERYLKKQQRRTENRFKQISLTFYSKSKLNKELNPVIFTLVSFSVVTALLAVINLTNWQFWLNLSLTIFVATLSLLHQEKKKQ